MDQDPCAWLDARWPDRAPFVSASLELPPGGPSAVALGAGCAALFYPPGRLAAERAGRERAALHPAGSALLDAGERALLVPRFGAAHPRPWEALPGGGAVTHATGSRRALLDRILPGVRWARALGRLGVRRRDVDRWLDKEVTAASRVGPSLGGVHPGLVREASGGPIALRWDHARAEGWLALDLAGLALSGDVPADEAALAARHRDAVGDEAAGDGADVAFELALVAVLTREAQRGAAGAAARVAERLAPRPAPERVQVWIEGPPFVPADLWEAPGATVSAARARWLLAQLDGLAVGGGRLAVRVDPPIRPGKRRAQREPAAERRRRLFSRWDEGIRADDEGRVGLTPEALALSLASGARGVVIDGTCGLGGIAIALARQPAVERVLAVDRDAGRLAMARYNARVYGVHDRIELIEGDIADVVAELEAELLVLDPPWGGRGYDRERTTLADLGLDVARVLGRFAGEVRLKLPRSFDLATLPPGPWTTRPMVDERGILKMLLAVRRG